MIQHNYISDFNGDLRMQDTVAHLSLSDYDYESLWMKLLKRNGKFQCKIINDGLTHMVWLVGEVLSVDNSTKFRNIERRGYQFQKVWEYSCEH